MAGVSVGFAKCFILFMAVVILAQGLVYLGLSLWGITLRDCQKTTDIASDPFGFAMDLIYFLDKNCENPMLEISGFTYELKMDWSKSFAITNREYIFMITYAVISGFWVASSCLVIFTLCFTTTKLISGTVYWPWYLSVLAGCILDVVATVYHGMDISNTTSLQDALNFVGATVPTIPDAQWSILENFGVYFSTPALVMLLISSRVLLIWLLNVIGGMFCLSLAHVLANQAAAAAAPAPAPAVSNSQHIQPRELPMSQQEQQQQQEQLPTAPMASASPSVSMEPQYSEPMRTKPTPFIIPAQTAEMTPQDAMYSPNDRTTLQSPVLVLPPHPQQQPQQPQPPQQFSPQPQPDINTYRTTDAHPDQLNYPPTEATSPRITSPAAQQIASGSALNSRYSEIYPAQPTNPRVSEELRNQMPWSYTSMITKPPPPPRKPQQQVQIYPQIPEPDYTEQ